MRLFQLFLSIILGMLLFLTNLPITVLAESPTAIMNVDGSDPLKPSIAITNESDIACQIVTTALGTVGITQISQGGETREAIPIETSFDESLEIILREHLTTLDPGETIKIPLRVFPFESRYAIETIVWSEAAGSFGTLYPIEPDKPLTLDVSYTIPITATGAPLCQVITEVQRANEPTERIMTIIPWKAIAIALTILLLLSILGIFLAKHKRGKKITAIIIFIGISATSIPPHQAYADFTVPDSLSGQWGECMAIFEANRDITGPVLDALNNPDVHVEIVHTTDGINDSARYGLDNFRIYWDPDTVREYHGTGGSSDACSTLFHEMYHAFDMIQGTYSREECSGSGIDTKEVMATRAQNQLRERLGLPPRSHYGDRTLPEGDCSDPAPEPPCTEDDCAESNGDPHLKTFDGLRYDFQAVGEFIAVRDTKTDDLEIHVRQAPWPDSRQVAVNTAVALRVGQDILELQLRERELIFLLNGKEQEITTKTLDNGNLTKQASNRMIVIWSDGTSATIRAIGSFGLHLIVDPAPTRTGNLEGLFGNFDGNKENDLVIKNTNTPIKPTFEELYPSYADSWRISQETSLFTYDSGKTTATYTNRSFPEKKVIIDQLPNRKAAEALCRQRGVTDPDVLIGCIIDVALTNQPDFALAAAIGQAMTNKIIDYGGKTWDVTITEPESVEQIAFEGKTNEKVFIDVPTSTFIDQCGILALRGPKNQLVSTGCIINGQGMIDGVTLPESGIYTLVVDPSGERIGAARIKLLSITDPQQTIEIDGKPLLATINKPGVVAKFTFIGKAGQRIFVDVPKSTIADQCGVLSLRGPKNQLVQTGCIINGDGYIDGVVLPEDGQYRIEVNPSNRKTGTATIQLIHAQDDRQTTIINGKETTLKINKPGAIAKISFSGYAGQRIFVEINQATLADQCGLLVLRDAQEKSVGASGCVINGQGGLDEKGIVLPETGTYTLTLNPTRRSTGKANVLLKSN